MSVIGLKPIEGGGYEAHVHLVDKRIVPLIDHDTQAPLIISQKELEYYNLRGIDRLHYITRMMEKHPQ